jgi:hypothetical protein
LLFPLFFCAILLPAAEDSPVFIIQNHRFSAAEMPAGADLPPNQVTLRDGSTCVASIEDTALHVRIGSTATGLIDPHVSAGAAPALAAFPDGSALLVWRGHGNNDLRDLYFARFVDNQWKSPAILSPDGWHVSTLPAGEGPALASRGAHVAVAWFTAAGGPRINVSTSSNAGVQWLMPVRVDDIAPIGRVSIVLLDDGAQLVSWVERLEGQYLILLRRVSPRGTLSVPVRLARLATDPGHPRLVRIKDGDATPAQLQLTYTENSNPVVRVITLPDASLLAEADACDCDPRPEDQRGYALKGRIISVDLKTSTLVLAHDEVPGLMKSATTTFKAAPDLLASARTGQRVFARTERIGPDWWLFNLRSVLAP